MPIISAVQVNINFEGGRVKIKCFRFECSQCGVTSYLSLLYWKVGSVSYAREGIEMHKASTNISKA